MSETSPASLRPVLFLCTANTCRSQMAEGLLRAHAGDRFSALSAGLNPGAEIHPLTRQVMAERGIDLSDARPKSVKEYLWHVNPAYVIAVCDRAARECPAVWPGVVTRLAWPLDDPASVEGPLETRLAAFRRVRDEIDARIREWLDTQP